MSIVVIAFTVGNLSVGEKKKRSRSTGSQFCTFDNLGRTSKSKAIVHTS